MPSYLLQRLVHAAIVIVVVVFVVSLIVKVIPGDPVDVMAAGNPGITEEQKDKLRAQLGLTRPALEQFASYLTGAVQGDLGQSIRFRVPVTQLIAERLPATLELTVFAMIIAMLIALPLGVVTALRRGSMVDYSGTVVAILGVSIPSFVLGILLIIVFAVDLAVAAGVGPRRLHPDRRVQGRRGGRRRRLLEELPLSPAALHSARALDHGVERAAHALGHAGGAAPGLRAVRPRQGAAEPRGAHPPRLPQRDDPDHHDPGPPARLPARRHLRDRERLRLAGRRAGSRCRRSSGATTRSSRASWW